MPNSNQFTFHKFKSSDLPLLQKWLKLPHINKWLHGEGLKNVLVDLEASLKSEGVFEHWIAKDHSHPFAYLLTSYIEDSTDAISLDVFICDLNYIGKGYSYPLITQLLVKEYSHVKRVYIDPEATNIAAIKAYEKIGFKKIKDFIAPWHPVPHFQMVLDMDLLIKNTLS